jgi:hypothetical protein
MSEAEEYQSESEPDFSPSEDEWLPEKVAKKGEISTEDESSDDIDDELVGISSNTKHLDIKKRFVRCLNKFVIKG